jgi:hypothetical protein
VGDPGEVAAFTDPETKAVMAELAAKTPGWRNEFAPRVLFSLLRYRPGGLAGRVQAPLLVCVADRDVAASTSLAVRAAERAPRGELRRYPVGHFDVYLGRTEQLAVDQAAFLCAHLVGAPNERRPDRFRAGSSVPDRA